MVRLGKAVGVITTTVVVLHHETSNEVSRGRSARGRVPSGSASMPVASEDDGLPARVPVQFRALAASVGVVREARRRSPAGRAVVSKLAPRVRQVREE